MRLDVYLTSKGKYPSRNKAREAVERGEVSVNGKPCKPSLEVDGSEQIVISSAEQYVSVGAYKLAEAFRVFGISAKGLTFADIGASAGGFTQVLLNNGAAKVYAVDVGEGLLDKSLYADPRVVPVENTNARNMTAATLGEQTDGVVSDVSFISLSYIMPSVSAVLKDGGYAVLLVKPQFECGREALNKNGIVTSPRDRARALKNAVAAARAAGLTATDVAPCPKKEGKNAEYLLLVVKAGGAQVSEERLERVAE